ncbi:MAG: trigger factor [Candidatus Xenobia bacterium]
MKATISSPAEYLRTVEVTVEQDQVNQSYDKVLGLAAREMAVPGFRKGKAPRHLVERHIRREYLQQSVLEDVGLKAYQEAIKENNISPLTNPDVEWVQFEKGKEMVFRATVQVKPEIPVPEFKAHTVKVPRTEVTSSDVDEVLSAEQMKRQRMVTVDEDRPLEKGDLANVNFESWIGEEPVPGGKAEGFLIELNDELFIPGFVDHLLGLKKDEEKRFTVHFPAEYKNPALADKDVTFNFKILEIKKRELPDLDDEFAREASRYTSMAELKAAIQEQLVSDLHTSIGNKVIDQLVDESKLALPGAMIGQTMANIVRDWDKQLQQMGTNLGQFMQARRISSEQLQEELRPRAERVARAELIVESIAKSENITVCDDEVEKEIDRFARMTNQDPTLVKETMEQEGTATYVRENLLRRKVLHRIYEETRVELEEAAPEPVEVAPTEG